MNEIQPGSPYRIPDKSFLLNVLKVLRSSAHPYVWFNGVVMLLEEALIPVTVHALHYASAVFEGLRAYRSHEGELRIWLLDKHIDRLFTSADKAKIRILNSRNELRQAILDIVALNDDGQVDGLYVRPLFFYAVDPKTGFGLGVDAAKIDVWVVLVVAPWGRYLEPTCNDGMRALVNNRNRPSADEVDGTMKHAGFYGLFGVPEKLNAGEAFAGPDDKGCSETIFAGPAVPGHESTRHVQDGSGQEIGVLTKEGVFQFVRPGAQNVLQSSTKAFLLATILSPTQKKYKVEHVDHLWLKDRRNWAAMFFMGTATEVESITGLRFELPDGSYRDELIGDGHAHPLVKEIAKYIQEMVRFGHPEYKALLPAVPCTQEAIQRFQYVEAFTDAAWDRIKKPSAVAV